MLSSCNAILLGWVLPAACTLQCKQKFANKEILIKGGWTLTTRAEEVYDSPSTAKLFILSNNI